MLNLKLFRKLVRQLIHITAALIGSNEEKHTKSSYTITLIEKLQINSYLRNQPRYSCIALYCAWTRDKFCSERTKIVVWGLDHPPPVDSLFRLTVRVSIYSLPREFWRKWAQCCGDTVCMSSCMCVALTYALHNNDRTAKSKGLTPNPA